MSRIRSADARVAEQAFAELFEAHHRGLLAFCRQIVRSREDAEDAVQHTFAAAHRTLRADDRPMQLRAWLYTVARHRCLSILRQRRDTVDVDDVDLDAGPLHAGAHAELRGDLQAMVADIRRLPEAQRSALVLFELGDHSHGEIAEVLGVKKEKVKALVFQARESLMQHREARNADCRQMRERLAAARGPALRTRDLRLHLEHCAGCRAYRTEVEQQRAALALVLPVVPSLGLKDAVLTAAATSAPAAVGAGASVGGVAATFKVLAAKVLIATAAVGGATYTVAASAPAGDDRPAVPRVEGRAAAAVMSGVTGTDARLTSVPPGVASAATVARSAGGSLPAASSATPAASSGDVPATAGNPETAPTAARATAPPPARAASPPPGRRDRRADAPSQSARSRLAAAISARVDERPRQRTGKADGDAGRRPGVGTPERVAAREERRTERRDARTETRPPRDDRMPRPALDPATATSPAVAEMPSPPRDAAPTEDGPARAEDGPGRAEDGPLAERRDGDGIAPRDDRAVRSRG
ncbi:sigma-70 family RNA polymerase sigma factor [Svornostia abyssi]|uniref:Sigma-70 family RNA polymerase sigma factor n=1 Tax=Svornostia abyssi TaxID=2898438 RepID=A0ABY5PAQ0_9ACTN|nr:sigma-70 family RNA polymerase sigma factor [Parviterribacteraceae bacterium J379]